MMTHLTDFEKAFDENQQDPEFSIPEGLSLDGDEGHQNEHAQSKEPNLHTVQSGDTFKVMTPYVRFATVKKKKEGKVLLDVWTQVENQPRKSWQEIWTVMRVPQTRHNITEGRQETRMENHVVCIKESRSPEFGRVSPLCAIQVINGEEKLMGNIEPIRVIPWTPTPEPETKQTQQKDTNAKTKAKRGPKTRQSGQGGAGSKASNDASSEEDEIDE